MEGIETHLVISSGARATIGYETDYDPDDVDAMADHVYAERDVGAGPASGTCLTDGMVVAPCSIKTLSAVATSPPGVARPRDAVAPRAPAPHDRRH